MTKKQIALIGTTGVVAAATVLSFGMAGAANQPGETLADKIASTFHLNKADVQKVIDQDHKDHQADRQAKLKERLDQAVKDGKITSAQETLIIDKLKELQTQFEANKDSLKDKTPAERRAIIEQQRTDLEKWAKDNGIDLKYLRPMGGPGMHHGMGMGMGAGQPDNNQ